MYLKNQRISPIKHLLISFLLFFSMLIGIFSISDFSTQVIFAWVVFTFASLPLSVSLLWFIQIISRRFWIKRSGTVIQSKVISEFILLQMDAMALNKYAPDIQYKYYVDSKMYISNDLSPIYNDFRFFLEQDAQKLLRDFPAHKNIDVWTHPKKPSQSIIIQGCSKEQTITMIGYAVMGIMLLGIGIFIFTY